MPRHAPLAAAVSGGRTGLGLWRCTLGRTCSNERERHRSLDRRNRETRMNAEWHRLSSVHFHCSSAEESGLYSGGVPLRGADSVGGAIAGGAMSFVFASSSSFFSSG